MSDRGGGAPVQPATLRGVLERLAPDRHVLLAGPTASGKSALALALAEAQGGMIVNADALQVHDCWQILTARPDAADLARAPHALYGHVGRGQHYSVGHWLREMQAMLARGARLIVTGGTGLYFTALTQGLAEVPEVPPEIRAEAGARLDRDGLAALLAALDAPTRARIDPANPARVQRAWEVLQATGTGLAAWQDRTPPPLLPLRGASPLLVQTDPAQLSRRIDARFDAMIRAGALDEVRRLHPVWDPAQPWARAIGAAPLIAHLDHRIGLQDAVEQAKAETRQFARRQRTWFRNRMRDWPRLTLPLHDP